MLMICCYIYCWYLEFHWACSIPLCIKVCFKSFVTWIIKLHNFFNICSRGTIENVASRFWVGQLQYKHKAQEILKFQWSQRRQKIKVLPQDFIPKTSTILYSITKEISKIYHINLKESNGSLKSFKSIKVQSYIHSYSFILWWVETTKMYL